MNADERGYGGGRRKKEAGPFRGLGTEIARLFSKVGLDSDVRELRGQKIKPPFLTLVPSEANLGTDLVQTDCSNVGGDA